MKFNLSLKFEELQMEELEFPINVKFHFIELFMQYYVYSIELKLAAIFIAINVKIDDLIFIYAITLLSQIPAKPAWQGPLSGL